MQLFSDNFTRANGALGSNWTTQSGTTSPTIVSNAVECATLANHTAAVYSGAAFPADHWAEIRLSTLNSDYAGPAVRMATGADTDYVAFASAPFGSSTSLTIAKRIASAYTQLAIGTFTVATGDLLRLSIVGTTLTLYLNGVSVLTATDSSINSGSAGFILRATSAATDVILDDFSAGDFGPLNLLFNAPNVLLRM